jgi:hypothetical protein
MKTTQLVLAVMTLLARNTNAGTQEQLEACRQQIDSLDQRIALEDGAGARDFRNEEPRRRHVPVNQVQHRIDHWWRCQRKVLQIGRFLVINAQSFAKISEVTAAAREEYSDNEG